MNRIRVPHRPARLAALLWIWPCVLAGCLSITPSSGYTPLAEISIQVDEPLVLPLLSGEVPIVQACFPGRSAAAELGIRMVVDTGAEASLLSRAAAEHMGLTIGKYRGASHIEGSAGGSREVTHYVAIDVMQLGDLQIERFYLSLVESEAFEAFDFDGVLGQDLLVQLASVFDMERRELTLLPTGIQEQEITEFIRARQDLNGIWRGEPIDFRPRPFVKFHLLQGQDRIPVELLIDTGATHTSMPQPICDLLGPPLGLRMKMGLDGRYQAKTYGLSNFPLCGFTIGGEVVGSRQEYGLLGMDILGDFVLILNGPAKAFLVHHRRIAPNPNR